MRDTTAHLTLDTLSRLKGIETKVIYEPWLMPAVRSFGYTFPFEGN